MKNLEKLLNVNNFQYQYYDKRNTNIEVEHPVAYSIDPIKGKYSSVITKEEYNFADIIDNIDKEYSELENKEKASDYDHLYKAILTKKPTNHDDVMQLIEQKKLSKEGLRELAIAPKYNILLSYIEEYKKLQVEIVAVSNFIENLQKKYEKEHLEDILKHFQKMLDFLSKRKTKHGTNQ